MSVTVAGVFDDYAAAQQACRTLEDRGIETKAIWLTGGRPDTALVRTDGIEPTGLRSFFAELLGIGATDAHAGHYAEAVHRGNAVVTVDAGSNEADIDSICDILAACGAGDIEQRVEQWQAVGERAERRRNPPAAAEPRASAVPAGPPSEPRGAVRLHRRADSAPVDEPGPMELRRRNRLAERGAAEASLRRALRRYSGPERRVGGGGPYGGVERRIGR